MQILNNLNLSKLQLQNAVLHPLASAPTGPVTGQGYYDTAITAPRYWNGTAWTLLATDSTLHGGSTLATVLSRVSHTGTQTSSTISDLATTVQAYRLDQFVAPNISLSLGSQRIINLADPTGTQDATTMGWVQSQLSNAAAGIDAKASVRIATTANVGLTGLTAIDGITPVAADRILVKNQTTASTNGVYMAAAGAWARATDADGTGELTPGAFWFVEEGTVNGKTQWRIENTGTITLGTTAITINQFGGSATYTASLGVQLVGSDFRSQVVVSGGISAVAGGLQLDTAVAARKYSVTIGDGTATAYTITHNLGTQDVITTVRDATTNAIVIADVVNASVNTITVTYATAPAANAYRVTVIG